MGRVFGPDRKQGKAGGQCMKFSFSICVPHETLLGGWYGRVIWILREKIWELMEKEYL